MVVVIQEAFHEKDCSNIDRDGGRQVTKDFLKNKELGSRERGEKYKKGELKVKEVFLDCMDLFVFSYFCDSHFYFIIILFN